MTDPDGSAAGAGAVSLPTGAKDVLPVEAAEIRAIERAAAGVAAAHGYLEVETPILELAAVLDRAQEGGLGRAFRLFDDTGRVLVLRPDLTIPVARLVATRLGGHPGPVRVTYRASAFRPPAPGRAEPVEERQLGAELVGLEGPEADAEIVALLVRALRAAGLRDVLVGMGDVALTTAALAGVGDTARRTALASALAARNLVAWRRAARAAALPPAAQATLEELPTLRGGREVLARVVAGLPALAPAAERTGRVLDLLGRHGVGESVLLDLGVLREWPYYSGVVFEGYARGVGAPVAAGGRYDGLAERFGRPRPAVGFALRLDLLHRALAAQTEPGDALRDGVVLAGGLDGELEVAEALRDAGITVVAAPAEPAVAEALAATDGWRWVAWRQDAGFAVRDRLSGASTLVAEVREVVRSGV